MCVLDQISLHSCDCDKFPRATLALAANLPEASEVRLELEDYLARTGMAPPDFARRINYSRETVYQFLNGN
jgi:hypothetical protein